MIRRQRRRQGLITEIANQKQEPDYLNQQVRLWVLRIVVKLQGYRQLFEGFHRSDTVISAILNITDPIDIEKNDRPRIFKKLKEMHREAERDATGMPPSTNPTLTSNLKRLGKLVGLSATDCRIMEFLTTLAGHALLESAAEYLGELSTLKFQHVLAVILALPEEEVKASLSPRAALEQSGLLRINRSDNHEMRNKFELLSSNFPDFMLSEEQEDPALILRDSVVPSQTPTLGLADFDHLGQELTVIRGHLQQCIAGGQKGGNIFLHGPPGTGKTELARVLAATINREMFEVASEDQDGKPIDAVKRLQALRAAQNIFARQPAFLLFDEAEDVFNDGGLFSKSTADTHKAWINRMLEENAIPTLWLSNSTMLDPAFVRRFDIVLEIPVPPRRRREQLVTEICGDLLGPEARARIATAESLAPAVLRRAMTVVGNIRGEHPGIDPAKALENLINNTLIVQGHAPLPKGDAGLLPAHYDLRYLAADADLATITAGLAASRNGRLCFYGPPGTGKTAFSQWLARQLDTPLHVRRASDLLGMYVGETEQNIARAFRAAERDQAVLLIDEADSFLQDRRKAEHSWEVTGVNEMLTQMEGYNGIFIASTNLLDSLDQASLRRFDLKIHFGYLNAAQAWPLFVSQCRALGLPRPPDKLKPALAAVTTLTPGDFAAVARRHKFQPLAKPTGLLAALESECALKNDGIGKPIGFV